MSETTGGPVPPQYDPAAQAAQAPDEGVIPGADTAADNVAAMAQQLADAKIRATLSGWEQQMQDTFAKAKAAMDSQTAALTAQITQLQGQLQAVRAQAGPPEALLLAKSAAQRVLSIASHNPDLPPGHFAGVTDQAQRLADAAEALANGKGALPEVERLAAGVERWFTRVHLRASGKPLEGHGALMEELERIVEGAASLAPAAEAIASAL